MHVRNIAPHAVNGPDGSWLLPAQSAEWSDEEYAAEMVSAHLVVDLGDDKPTDPAPTGGPTPVPDPEPTPEPTPVPTAPSDESAGEDTHKRSRKR